MQCEKSKDLVKVYVISNSQETASGSIKFMNIPLKCVIP